MDWGGTITNVITLGALCSASLLSYFAMDRDKRSELVQFLQSAKATGAKVLLRIGFWGAMLNSALGFYHFAIGDSPPTRLEIAFLFAHFFNFVGLPMLVGVARVAERAAKKTAKRDAEVDALFRQITLSLQSELLPATPDAASTPPPPAAP